MAAQALALSPDAIQWRAGGYGPEPYWSTEPSIETIERLARRYLLADADASCHVVKLEEGSFNKVYKIVTDNQTAVVRVALPVDPLKTDSEVATMLWVRRETCIPVPKIFAFDTTCDNELRLPWILMEFEPGQSLDKRWRYLDMDTKRRIVKDIAMYQSELFRHRFDAIGSLHFQARRYDRLKPTSRFSPPSRVSWLMDIIQMVTLIPIVLYVLMRQMVGLGFLPTASEAIAETVIGIGRRTDYQYYLSPGAISEATLAPQRSTTSWLRNRVVIAKDRICRYIGTPFEADEASAINVEAEALCEYLNSGRFDNDPTVLYYHDLHEGNILLDENDKIAAILDWEFVATVPLRWACRSPKLLGSPEERHVRPDEKDYGHWDDLKDDPELSEDDFIDGIEEAYWDQLEQYEKTILRKLFLEEMGRLQPDWLRLHNDSGSVAEIEEFVCDVDRELKPEFLAWLAEGINKDATPTELADDGDCTLVEDADVNDVTKFDTAVSDAEFGW